MMLYVGIIAAVVTFVFGSGVMLVRDLMQRDIMARRISIAVSSGTQVRSDDRPRVSAFIDRISAIGLFLVSRGLLSKKTVGEVQTVLENAGMRSRSAFGVFLGTKVILMITCPLLVLLVGFSLGKRPIFVILAAIISLIVGMLAPEFVLHRIRANYVQKVESGAADGLDMLVICVDAGLGLQSAFLRVAEEMRNQHAAFSQELMLTVRELQIGAAVDTALKNLRDRTDVEAFRRLSSTLTQAMSYGTPLTQALRSLSSELRQLALVRFEEKAARLPVMLTVPMILFILPSLFAIIAGPAAMNVLHTLKTFGGH